MAEPGEQMPSSVLMKKHNGELIPANSLSKIKRQMFIDSLPEGTKIEETLEPLHGNASYSQYSKIHKCIREIASETGESFERTKLLVKEKAGLYTTKSKLKSFADCTRDELDMGIKAAMDLADFLGINLNN